MSQIWALSCWGPSLAGNLMARAACALLEVTRGGLKASQKRWQHLTESAGNYGPTVFVQQEAKKKGCEQVLWLYGPDHELTEVGTMNIFIYWTHEDGVLELVTPPLDGVILPGVVRQSLLDLAKTWGEFRVVERKITMKMLVRALEEGRVREVFGSGTACQVCPVHQIMYQGKNLHIPTMDNGPELIERFYNELKAIQYGAKAHEWMLQV